MELGKTPTLPETPRGQHTGSRSILRVQHLRYPGIIIYLLWHQAEKLPDLGAFNPRHLSLVYEIRPARSNQCDSGLDLLYGQCHLVHTSEADKSNQLLLSAHT